MAFRTCVRAMEGMESRPSMGRRGGAAPVPWITPIIACLDVRAILRLAGPRTPPKISVDSHDIDPACLPHSGSQSPSSGCHATAWAGTLHEVQQVRGRAAAMQPRPPPWHGAPEEDIRFRSQPREQEMLPRSSMGHVLEQFVKGPSPNNLSKKRARVVDFLRRWGLRRSGGSLPLVCEREFLSAPLGCSTPSTKKASSA